MAAIFYDAVEATMPVVQLDRGAGSVDPKDVSTFGILVKGKNPGYATGDVVQYKDRSGNIVFSAPIKKITVGAPYLPNYPEGYVRLFVSPANAATIFPLNSTSIGGGSLSPVTSASATNSSQKVVSAATILKDGGTAAPAVAPVKSVGFMGITPKKALIGVGVLVAAIWIGKKVFKKGK